MSQLVDHQAQNVNAQPATGSNMTLDPSDWKNFRLQAHEMLDDMVEYIKDIRKRPVWQPIPNAVRARLRTGLPELPTDLAAVHNEFMQHILPFAAGNVHPGFMGWVHGGGTPVGMLAEMLAAGLNANLGGRDHTPVEVERQVVQWVRELFGFPQPATGLFVTGTSMANLIAVIVARDVELGFGVRQQGVAANTKRLTAYGSTAVHGCIAKAMDLSGLGSDALRTIATDSRHRIGIEALEQAIHDDRRAGFTPFFVVGSAGTVDTGAIDDLASLANLCQREGLWFHVDGAYGALAMLAPDLAPRLKGIERADSLAFDFHKWGQVPYDAGFILVRNGQLHQRSFDSSAAYLKREVRGLAAGAPWPCDFGPDLSRGFHALKTWFTLKVHGTKALGAVISRTCELARYLEARIAATAELELLAPVELNIVCFRYRTHDSDRINAQIVVDLQECGSVAPSTTTIHGQLAIRAAIVNHRTSCAEIDILVDETLALGRALQTNSAPRPAPQPPPEVQQHTDMQLALQSVERQPQLEPTSIILLFQRACLLEQTGRSPEARTIYLELSEGRRVWQLAVAHHPNHLPWRASLGNLLIKSSDLAAARDHFEHALRIDPDYRPAHAGLSFVLGDLGDPDRAAWHRAKAFKGRSVVITRYRGERPPITILELISTTGGNIRTDEFLSDRVFQRILVTTEFYDPKTILSPHQLVLNAIGEADGASAALNGALSVLAHLDARGSDGNSRKYRVMMVDGQLYPLHVAISGNWKIHYYTADMADHPEHRVEDSAFLTNMSGVLSPGAISALRQIQATLGLDYDGIDFGLNKEGDVLLFEANATMAIVVPEKDPRWDYCRPATEQIYTAVWKMLKNRATAAEARTGSFR